MPEWLMDIWMWFGDAWVAWTVSALSLSSYAVMTLTLRTKEPKDLAERLKLTHGQVSDSKSEQEVLDYRTMRLVLEGVRVVSVVVFVIGAMRLVTAYRDDLDFLWLLIVGGAVPLVLIMVRVSAIWLLDHCYDYVDMWVDPFAGLARLSGKILLFRRSASDFLYERNGTAASKQHASYLLTVARNLALDDVRATDLMVPVANAVAVERDYSAVSLSTVLMDSATDFAVVCGKSINDVLGAVYWIDLERALRTKNRRELTAKSAMRRVVKLTPSQQLGSLVDAFQSEERGHELGIVIGEDGTFMGTLTYSQVLRTLFSEEEPKKAEGDESSAGTAEMLA